MSRLPKINPIERAIQLLQEQRRQTDLQIQELRALLPRQKSGRARKEKPYRLKLSTGRILEL